mmetsp:Transcript_34131/g.86342  ORF Transcript_34131/g.86342 Transcript_34131/m.86342 type:complete len:225 (-) Transcript_34131:1734-2408(-)
MAVSRAPPHVPPHRQPRCALRAALRLSHGARLQGQVLQAGASLPCGRLHSVRLQPAHRLPCHVPLQPLGQHVPELRLSSRVARRQRRQVLRQLCAGLHSPRQPRGRRRVGLREPCEQRDVCRAGLRGLCRRQPLRAYVLPQGGLSGGEREDDLLRGGARVRVTRQARGHQRYERRGRGDLPGQAQAALRHALHDVRRLQASVGPAAMRHLPHHDTQGVDVGGLG